MNNISKIRYLAGIIDGDGYITVFNSSKDSSKFSPLNRWRVGLEQRYKPLVQYMSNSLSGSNVWTRASNSKNHVTTYCWNHSTTNILEFLIKIEPYLIEKKDKCKKLIMYIKMYIKLEKLARATLL